jgi:hypothetical protein
MDSSCEFIWILHSHHVSCEIMVIAKNATNYHCYSWKTLE